MRSPVQLALAYFNAQTRGDRDALDELLHEDFVASTPAGPFSKPEALEMWAGKWAALPPSPHLEVVNVEPVTGGVLIELEMLYTFDDGVHRHRVCDVMSLRDGRIDGLRAYYDTAGRGL